MSVWTPSEPMSWQVLWKNFVQKEMEAVWYAYNVYVVCRSGLLRKPSPTRSTKGVLSRKKLTLCYMHVTCMLYAGSGLLRKPSPNRRTKGVLSRKKWKLCYKHITYILYVGQDSFRTLVRRNRSSKGVLSRKKLRLCYIHVTYMLYVDLDSFGSPLRTGAPKEFCPERNGSYVISI